MVVNASNRDKILEWLRRHDPQNKAGLEDRTHTTAMIAVQGPLAVPAIHDLLGVDVAGMGYYSGQFVNFQGYPLLVSRTGYTGEDGVELIAPNEHAVALWELVLARGASAGFRPAGLGARDTLRLEAAMPLYGHELSEEINPAHADLGFAINLKDRHFVGRDAILAAQGLAGSRRRVGLELDGRRPARENCPVVTQGQTIGIVTSGTFAPTLQKPIAMAYVDPSFAEVGRSLEVDIRGKLHAATVVKLPFYSRA
jgi:aminomethyltransferase